MAADSDDSLSAAMQEAGQALQSGNHPFGAVLVMDGIILERARNTVADAGPIFHAEMNLVFKIFRRKDIKSLDLSRATLVSSCEPCPMCLETIKQAGIGKVAFGYSKEKLREMSNKARGARQLRSTSVHGPNLKEPPAEHAEFWRNWDGSHGFPASSRVTQQRSEIDSKL
eukprot:TRINITY_DN27805_c0_g1_i1.p1 TRINITY_DN27805_c0_g1~~TRINITY_DN27805_c0_g1_i1.p1  ORF type:complete len:170 (-),score=36.16 TRINITY_DN27805_c0_g1_i1:91-600(-)